MTSFNDNIRSIDPYRFGVNLTNIPLLVKERTGTLILKE